MTIPGPPTTWEEPSSPPWVAITDEQLAKTAILVLRGDHVDLSDVERGTAVNAVVEYLIERAQVREGRAAGHVPLVVAVDGDLMKAIELHNIDAEDAQRIVDALIKRFELRATGVDTDPAESDWETADDHGNFDV